MNTPDTASSLPDDVCGQGRRERGGGQQAQPVAQAGQPQRQPEPTERRDGQHRTDVVVRRLGQQRQGSTAVGRLGRPGQARAHVSHAGSLRESADSAVRTLSPLLGRRSSSRWSSWPWSSSPPSSWRWSSWRPSSCAAALLGRAPRTLVGQQLGGTLGGDGRRVVVLAQRRVDLTVSDVRAEPAVLHHDRLAGDRVVAELAQRCGRRLAAAALGLGVDRPAPPPA